MVMPAASTKPQNDLGGGDFQRIRESCYRLRFEEWGIQFDVDRLRRKNDEQIGELTVRCDLAGALVTEDNILSVGDFNLSSSWALERHAGLLQRRAKTKGLDWFLALQ